MPVGLGAPGQGRSQHRCDGQVQAAETGATRSWAAAGRRDGGRPGHGGGRSRGPRPRHGRCLTRRVPVPGLNFPQPG